MLELHLPYFALRRSKYILQDTRKLRKSRTFLRADQQAVNEDHECIHEAQISFLITGVDEWFWTALCCVDSFFEAERPIDVLYQEQKDAPTGGMRRSSKPMWNPRQYFLIVLAVRLRQVRKEWENILFVIDERLSKYVS